MRWIRAVAVLGVVCVSTTSGSYGASNVREAAAARGWTDRTVVVGYRAPRDLAAALRAHPALVVRRLPTVRAAELRPRGSASAFAAAIATRPGIEYVEPLAARESKVEPALFAGPRNAIYEWQYTAARLDSVPDWVLRAAAGITIAIVDTGADLSAPDLAAKAPSVYVVRSGRGDGTFSDVDEAAGIVYAVDHGAKVINLSVGGPHTSLTERRAVDYAISHGALLVAAAGNERDTGNPSNFRRRCCSRRSPTAPPGEGSQSGRRPPTGVTRRFSNSGSYLSLVAPGVDVFGAVSGLLLRCSIRASRSPARTRASMGSRAGRLSRRLRSPARRRSCGLRIRRSTPRRSRKSSSRRPRASARGRRSSASASSTSRPPSPTRAAGPRSSCQRCVRGTACTWPGAAVRPSTASRRRATAGR